MLRLQSVLVFMAAADAAIMVIATVIGAVVDTAAIEAGITDGIDAATYWMHRQSCDKKAGLHSAWPAFLL